MPALDDMCAEILSRRRRRGATHTLYSKTWTTWIRTIGKANGRSPRRETPMNTELVVTMFDSEDAASAAYEALRRLEQNGGIAILDAATLVKHGDGTSEIKDTQDVDTRHGAYFGVISGALIGLVGGPAGALIGSVAGAATGAASASMIDFGFPKADLQSLYDQLANGSSALVVLLEMTWLDQLEAALADFGGHSTRRSLHADAADRI